jgi:ketosteroid isomerase-like protein
MKKLLILIVLVTSFVFQSNSTNAQTGSNQQVAEEIIAMVKAQWAAQISDPANANEQFKNTADEYTEFNSDYSTRVEGKALAMKLSEAGSKGAGRVLAAEMLNPKVQVYGDVAILSYNYAGVVSNKDGESKPARAKTSRVYAKQGGKWKLVHANFGSDPLSED